MLFNFSEQLYKEVSDQLAETEPVENDPVGQFKHCLKCVKAAIGKLHLYLADHPFTNEAEERRYDERVLPKFRALEFYYYELVWLTYNRPIGDNFEWLLYYQQELSAVRHFLSRHAAYYQCYKIKTMELEEILPGNSGFPALTDHYPFKDNDELFAKFIAYDKLQGYILAQIKQLRDLENAAPKLLRAYQLKWTGDHCNLVELAYGIYETKQLNQGEASLTDIFTCLEQMFQVNLHRANRAFIDIKRRKIMSHTRFIEQMRTAVQHKIEQEDAYVPLSFRQGYDKH